MTATRAQKEGDHLASREDLPDTFPSLLSCPCLAHSPTILNPRPSPFQDGDGSSACLQALGPCLPDHCANWAPHRTQSCPVLSPESPRDRRPVPDASHQWPHPAGCTSAASHGSPPSRHSHPAHGLPSPASPTANQTDQIQLPTCFFWGGLQPESSRRLTASPAHRSAPELPEHGRPPFQPRFSQLPPAHPTSCPGDLLTHVGARMPCPSGSIHLRMCPCF